jgi:hypothetical protein
MIDRQTGPVRICCWMSPIALSLWLLVPNCVAAERQFVSNEYFTFGSADDFTVAVELSDLDLDGDLDAIVVNGRHWARQDRIMYNNGHGRFLTATPLGELLATGYRPAIADLNSDGAMDIVVARDRVPSHIFMNDGNGAFIDHGPIGPVGPTRAILAADVNMDQHPDLVFSLRGEPNEILYGPTFEESRTLDSADKTVRLASADLDGDRNPDLVFADIGSEGNLIAFNNGSGSFLKSVRLDSRYGPSVDVAIADINGDDLPDIVFASIVINSVFLNDSRQSFEKVIEFGSSGEQSYGIALGDLDNDGRIDIVIANAGSPNAIYMNTGSGLVETVLKEDISALSYGVSIGDLDGNGFEDLVFANSGEMSRIYLNLPKHRE